jgi:hypothetical protein
MKCPKCGGKMLPGQEENLDDAFKCTRPKPKKQERHGYKIQSYVYDDCGCMNSTRKRVDET